MYSTVMVTRSHDRSPSTEWDVTAWRPVALGVVERGCDMSWAVGEVVFRCHVWHCRSKLLPRPSMAHWGYIRMQAFGASKTQRWSCCQEDVSRNVLMLIWYSQIFTQVYEHVQVHWLVRDRLKGCGSSVAAVLWRVAAIRRRTTTLNPTIVVQGRNREYHAEAKTRDGGLEVRVEEKRWNYYTDTGNAVIQPQCVNARTLTIK